MKFPRKAENSYEAQLMGRSCATYHGYLDAPGVTIRFDRPFDPQEGREFANIKTSRGMIYLKFLMSLAGTRDTGTIDGTAPEGIEHYCLADIKMGHNLAPVGMCLLADYQYYYEEIAARDKEYQDYYTNLAKTQKPLEKEIENKLGDSLIYKSPRFLNTVHYYQKTPYLTLFIYDKEKVNEIQAG